VPVDLFLEFPTRRVIIEIEAHRADPSNNIAKVLYWYEHAELTSKISIIQLFSPYYKEHPMKRKISEYRGQILTERHPDAITYRSFSIRPELAS
jgi:hypothetical protein